MPGLLQKTADLMLQIARDTDGIGVAMAEVPDDKTGHALANIFVRFLKLECQRKRDNSDLHILSDEGDGVHFKLGDHELKIEYDTEHKQVIIVHGGKLPIVPMLDRVRLIGEDIHQHIKRRGDCKAKIYVNDYEAIAATGIINRLAKYHDVADDQLAKLEGSNGRFLLQIPHATHHKIKQNEELSIPRVFHSVGSQFREVLEALNNTNTTSNRISLSAERNKTLMTMLIIGLEAVTGLHNYFAADVLLKTGNATIDAPPYFVRIENDSALKKTHIETNRPLPANLILKWYEEKVAEFGALKADKDGNYYIPIRDKITGSQWAFILGFACNNNELDPSEFIRPITKDSKLTIRLNKQQYELLQQEMQTGKHLAASVGKGA